MRAASPSESPSMRPAMRIANGAAKSAPSSHSPAGTMAAVSCGGGLRRSRRRTGRPPRASGTGARRAPACACARRASEVSIIRPSDARTRFCSASTVVAARGLSASRACAWPVTSHPPSAGSHDTGSASRRPSSAASPPGRPRGRRTRSPRRPGTAPAGPASVPAYAPHGLAAAGAAIWSHRTIAPVACSWRGQAGLTSVRRGPSDGGSRSTPALLADARRPASG